MLELVTELDLLNRYNVIQVGMEFANIAQYLRENNLEDASLAYMDVAESILEAVYAVDDIEREYRDGFKEEFQAKSQASTERSEEAGQDWQEG